MEKSLIHKKKNYCKPVCQILGKVNDFTKKNQGGTIVDNIHNTSHRVAS